MKKLIKSVSYTLFAAAFVVSLASLSSCSEKSESKSDSDNLISFESFSFEGVANSQLSDTIDGKVETTTYLWNCLSSGVLPVSADGKDIKALRDTICNLASISVDDNGKLSARLPDDLKPAEGNAKASDAKSVINNSVSVRYLSPHVAVFDIYAYQYPEGAAHGSYSNTYINYDLASGKVITPAYIFKPGYEQKLTELIRARVANGTDLLVDVKEVNIPKNFEITNEGINFVYSIYEIAPYSAGEPSVTIYAADLADLLTPAGKALFPLAL